MFSKAQKKRCTLYKNTFINHSYKHRNYIYPIKIKVIINYTKTNSQFLRILHRWYHNLFLLHYVYIYLDVCVCANSLIGPSLKDIYHFLSFRLISLFFSFHIRGFFSALVWFRISVFLKYSKFHLFSFEGTVI